MATRPGAAPAASERAVASEYPPPNGITFDKHILPRVQSTLFAGHPSKKLVNYAGVPEPVLQQLLAKFTVIRWETNGVKIVDENNIVLVHVTRQFEEYEALEKLLRDFVEKIDRKDNKARSTQSNPSPKKHQGKKTTARKQATQSAYVSARASAQSPHTTYDFGQAVPPYTRPKDGIQPIMDRPSTIKYRKELEELLAHPLMQRFLKWQAGILQTEYPNRWATLQELLSQAWAAYGKEPKKRSRKNRFPSPRMFIVHDLMTFNHPVEGSNGVLTKPHLDRKNSAENQCLIFNMGEKPWWKYLLALYDLGAAVETKRGTLTIMPSSLMFHGNRHLPDMKSPQQISQEFGPALLQEIATYDNSNEYRWSTVFFTQGSTDRALRGGQNVYSVDKKIKQRQLARRTQRLRAHLHPQRHVKLSSISPKSRMVNRRKFEH